MKKRSTYHKSGGHLTLGFSGLDGLDGLIDLEDMAKDEEVELIAAQLRTMMVSEGTMKRMRKTLVARAISSSFDWMSLTRRVIACTNWERSSSAARFRDPVVVEAPLAVTDVAGSASMAFCWGV